MMPVTVAVLRTYEQTPRNLVLPPPSDTVWNQGIVEQVMNTTNLLGELTFDESVVSERQPFTTLSYPKWSKELIAIKTGLALSSQSITDAALPRSFQVQQAEYAGGGPGEAGNGLAADQSSSEAYALIDGISTLLTRQPFASFNAATNNSWAQGANGALRFSTNIVAGRYWVTTWAQYTATADVLTHDPFELFSLTLFGALHQDGRKYAFDIRFNRVQTNKQDNSEINFKATPVQVPFRIADLDCVPRLRFHNRGIAC